MINSQDPRIGREGDGESGAERKLPEPVRQIVAIMLFAFAAVEQLYNHDEYKGKHKYLHFASIPCAANDVILENRKFRGYCRQPYSPITDQCNTPGAKVGTVIERS
jgi:hypothetical protein